ncbi:UDP-N-acetylmuramate dehydrogenase [Croceiramulus getboli]|nr:UDP-N-acetylmuramate dehydrogenase [Flavobacteriaceae bacterium YJPT1-3]
MNIRHNVSLAPYNTFGIAATAAHFISVKSVAELQEALALEEYPQKFILGGGSNMLIKNDLDCLVIHIAIKGIETLEEMEESIKLRVMAGENWHELVLYCMAHDYGGLENLSLIPGNTGTAPVQNIGAYGVELKDTFVQCEAVHRETQELRTFSLEDCQFGYRESVFKNELKDQYVIVSVDFKLSRKQHQLHTEYGAIQQTLEERGIAQPRIQDISEAVIAIRQSKLPDPKKIGNSGSFFKNPLISAEAFKQLRAHYPDAPYYPIGSDTIKVPAGWLIEKAGFKGKRFGDAGVHDKQALVLVNHGKATGDDLWQLAMKIQKKVEEQFGITIQPEVNIVE